MFTSEICTKPLAKNCQLFKMNSSPKMSTLKRLCYCLNLYMQNVQNACKLRRVYFSMILIIQLDCIKNFVH